MGNFRIVIEATGGHGVDRSPKEGEHIDFFKEGQDTADAFAKQITEVSKWKFGNVISAKLIHWPNSGMEVVDDLLTCKREKGNF